MIYAFIALCGLLSFLAAYRSYFFPLKIAAGFSWLGFLIYWLTDPPIDKATPADTAMIMILIFMMVMFFLWAFLSRKTTVDVSVTRKRGGVSYTSNYKEPKTSRNQTTEEKNLFSITTLFVPNFTLYFFIQKPGPNILLYLTQ